MRTGIGSDRIETDVFFFFFLDPIGGSNRVGVSWIENWIGKVRTDGFFFLLPGPSRSGENPQKNLGWRELSVTFYRENAQLISRNSRGESSHTMTCERT